MIKKCSNLAVFVAGLALVAGCGGTSAGHDSGSDASVDAGRIDGSTGDAGSLDASLEHDAGPAVDGTLCGGPDDCASGFCVDGVCCEAACGGLCQSCRGAETGALDGVCQPVMALTDPASECALDEASCAPGTCDGAGACVLGADGSVCRPEEGSCDVAEICSGGVCPSDVLQPDGFECRTVEGSCDVAEHCDGVSAACPEDALTQSGATCRAASAACDAPELCSGLVPGCPADTLAPATTVCRPAAGSCEVPESCTGSGLTCPSDVTTPMSCPALANSWASCVAGDCTYTCNSSWGDCNANPGCETPLNTHSNCGRCGQSCGPFTCRSTTNQWACRP